MQNRIFLRVLICYGTSCVHFSLNVESLRRCGRATGATVMPHNIVLHSSLIQSRGYPRTTAGKRMALRVRLPLQGL